jgi:NlpC/P60 family putative phage cell wall peptidase
MTRADLVVEARSWIGTPFRHQASLKAVGVDCLGLIAGLYCHAVPGRMPDLPPYAADWALEGQGERLLDGLSRYLAPCATDVAQQGDVLVFRWRSHLPAMHLAILSEAQSLIHVHQHAEVCEVPLTNWWQRHCVAAFSFPL